MRKLYQQMNEGILPNPELLERVRQKTQEPKKTARAPQPIRRLGIAAVCCLLIVSVLSIPALSRIWEQDPSVVGPTGPTGPTVPQNQILTPLTPGEHQKKVLLQNGALYFSGDVDDDARKIFNANADMALALPAGAQKTIWNQEQMTAYLGRDFRPDWVPEDLKELDGEPAYAVYHVPDGQILLPFLYATYAESFDTDYDPYRRTLTIEAGKGEVPFSCGLYLSEEEQKSNIGGQEISVGYSKVAWGWTPKPEHKPSGYFDRYVAEFMVGDMGYRVVAENLTQEEFIQVLLSMVEEGGIE